MKAAAPPGGWAPGWTPPLHATPLSERGLAALAAVEASPVAAMHGIERWWGWQQHAWAVTLDTRPDGAPAAATVTVLLCRQNGKTSWLLGLMTVLMTQGRSVAMTMHQRILARAKMGLLFAAHRRADLARGGRPRWRISELRGEESIVDVRTGGRCRLATPDDAGGRSATEDVLIVDEAGHITPAYLRAARASTLTRRHAQTVLISSGLTHRSEDVHRAVEAAVGQLDADPADRSHAILTWQPRDEPGLDGLDVTDETLWERWIPTLDLPGGARRSVLRAALLETPPEVWAREYLAVPTGLPGGGVISAARWAAVCAHGRTSWQRSAHREVALGIAAAPDQSAAAVAVAGVLDSGVVSGALLSHGAGDGWLLADTLDAARTVRPLVVVVDARSPAASLRERIEQAGWPVEVTGAQQMARSSASMWTMISDDPPTVQAVDDPALTVAARRAVRRPVGDVGWAWGRRGAGGDVSPLEALTLAAAWSRSRPTSVSR